VGTPERSQGHPHIEIRNDLDDRDILAVMPAPVKKPQLFLDSDDDNDDISVT
jgi:hypothetical protein